MGSDHFGPTFDGHRGNLFIDRAACVEPNASPIIDLQEGFVGE